MIFFMMASTLIRRKFAIWWPQFISYDNLPFGILNSIYTVYNKTVCQLVSSIHITRQFAIRRNHLVSIQFVLQLCKTLLHRMTLRYFLFKDIF